jgi:hypothetical protein
MKTTLKLFALIVFLFVGVFVATAQDLIVMRNGEIIDTRVTEISPTEIRYRRIDFLDGPVFVIPVADVLSIRFENGTTQVFNQAPIAGQSRAQTQTVRTTDNAIDPDRFIFGISAVGGGMIGSEFGGGGGLRFEFGKGNFNAELNLGGGYPAIFSGLATFNYFWHGRIGGFFLGGGLGYSLMDYYCCWDCGRKTGSFFQFGLNTGYKFVTRSGVFFRTGAFIGGAVGNDFLFIFNPDISFGWTMR